MTNTKSPKTNPALIARLNSNDPAVAIETINQLRDSGNPAYLPELIGLLSNTDDHEIKSGIISLLSDLKMKDAIPVFIEFIQEPKYTAIKKDLVALCWQNSLDFSPYLSLFVDMVIEADFEVSFEAYTVVTNLTGTITDEMMNREIEKIEAVLHQVQPDKKQLLIDIIDFLPSISQ